MEKLTDVQLRALDMKLFDYVKVDKLIAIRKVELQGSLSTDENVVGSKGNNVSRPTEEIIAKWSTDIVIRNLELFKETVDELRLNLNPELAEIFALRWIEGRGQIYYTWEEIAEKLHLSRKGVYRRRESILTIFQNLQK